LALLGAIASVQIGGAFAKTLFGKVGPEGTAVLRTAFAALILTAVWRPWHGRLEPRQIRVVAAYGVALGSMNLLFYLALKLLPMGIAVAIEFTGPFTLALLSSRRIRDLVWLALAVAGLVSLLPIGQATRSIDPLGAAFALGAGTAWAFYILLGQKAAGLLPAGRVTALGMLAACLVTLPFGIGGALGALSDPPVVAVAVAVALLSSAIPYNLEMLALKRLPTRVFGVLMSLEPAFAAVAGIIVLGETLSALQWAAIACIILASVGSTATAAPPHCATDSRTLY
jgi:inner membrane transporter RhtA